MLLIKGNKHTSISALREYKPEVTFRVRKPRVCISKVKTILHIIPIFHYKSNFGIYFIRRVSLKEKFSRGSIKNRKSDSFIGKIMLSLEKTYKSMIALLKLVEALGHTR